MLQFESGIGSYLTVPNQDSVQGLGVQLKTRITEVLITVARLELSPDTPILARSAVTPAKRRTILPKKTIAYF
jgi:hypothetical protein